MAWTAAARHSDDPIRGSPLGQATRVKALCYLHDQVGQARQTA
jgi:hypothetical protein